jgi:hypothetical protein
MDPYYRERRRQASLRDEVRDAREDLDEHLSEFRRDGVITAKEQRKLDEDQAELDEALRKLEYFESDVED